MRFIKILIFFQILILSGCTFSLAEDITPPPDYTSPAPVQDSDILYPPNPPSPARGEGLFVENCVPCHGENGLGNGPLAGELPVAVPAIGLRVIAMQSSPVNWYRRISLGNAERGMPSFVNLSPEERWDILAYALLLSSTDEDLAVGQTIYENNCVECHGMIGDGIPGVDFTDVEIMSEINGESLYRIISEGRGQMMSFSNTLSENDIRVVSAYVQSISFDMTSFQRTATHAPEVTLTPESLSVLPPEGMPSSTSSEAENPSLTTMDVTGIVSNGSGSMLIQGLQANLMIYQTKTDEISTTLTTDISDAGTFVFTEISHGEDRAYWVTVTYQGVTYFSDYSLDDNSVQTLDLPVEIFDATEDWSGLIFDQVHILSEVTGKIITANELFVIHNPGERTVVLQTDGTSLPFIRLPDGIPAFTSLAPDTRGTSFLPASGGIAIPPWENAQYVVVATFSIPFEDDFVFRQYIDLPVKSLTLFVPENVSITTEILEDYGTEDFSGTSLQMFRKTDFPGGLIEFEMSRRILEGELSQILQRPGLIAGVVVLGIGFIVLGILLFLRDRAMENEEIKKAELEEQNEKATSSSDMNELVDAIIALDEQFKAGGMNRKVYEKRRAELKTILKSLSIEG